MQTAHATSSSNVARQSPQFEHDDSSLQRTLENDNDTRQQPICKYYLNGTCWRKECPFSHAGDIPQRSKPMTRYDDTQHKRDQVIVFNNDTQTH